VSGRIDHLYGLKENVIVGRLIPAGTGTKSYQYFSVDPVPAEEMPSPAEESEPIPDYQDELAQLLPRRGEGG